MNDTPKNIEKRFMDMIMAHSPEERLMMSFSMFDSARKLVKSSIIEKQPDISAVEMKKAIFLRIYGDEFNEIDKKKILAALEKA